jgi:hypothetical protein
MQCLCQRSVHSAILQLSTLQLSTNAALNLHCPSMHIARLTRCQTQSAGPYACIYMRKLHTHVDSSALAMPADNDNAMGHLNPRQTFKISRSVAILPCRTMCWTCQKLRTRKPRSGRTRALHGTRPVLQPNKPGGGQCASWHLRTFTQRCCATAWACQHRTCASSACPLLASQSSTCHTLPRWVLFGTHSVNGILSIVYCFPGLGSQLILK